jgi:hypothetical protein
MKEYYAIYNVLVAIKCEGDNQKESRDNASGIIDNIPSDFGEFMMGSAERVKIVRDEEKAHDLIWEGE